MRHPLFVDIFSIPTLEDLRYLNVHDFRARRLTQPEFEHMAKLCSAFWKHDGKPEHPHAELSGGECSDGFINVLSVLCYTNLCRIMALTLYQMLTDEFQRYGKHWPEIDWVVGSDHAGAALAHDVASLLNAKFDFTEKGPKHTQVWKRFQIGTAETVLQVEELVTTTQTLQDVRFGLRAAHPQPVTFYPVALTLVNRSNVQAIEDTPIVSFANYDIKKWKPEDCPLCKAGSKRLRPKQHWAELTQP